MRSLEEIIRANQIAQEKYDRAQAKKAADVVGEPAKVTSPLTKEDKALLKAMGIEEY